MDVKMPRKTPHKSQIKNGRPSLETIEYGHSPGGLASTQFLSGGKSLSVTFILVDSEIFHT
jgi:hypothetical protein